MSLRLGASPAPGAKRCTMAVPLHPSLPQHWRHRCPSACTVEKQALAAEKELEFDLDIEVLMSERSRAALEFMFIQVAVARYGNNGQPLWSVVPSYLYRAFLAGEAKDARILVVIFDASVNGWGAVVRSSREERGTEIVGGYSLAEA
jgi:hypothetical protein